jgi:hypothetical protein
MRALVVARAGGLASAVSAMQQPRPRATAGEKSGKPGVRGGSEAGRAAAAARPTCRRTAYTRPRPKGMEGALAITFSSTTRAV